MCTYFDHALVVVDMHESDHIFIKGFMYVLFVTDLTIVADYTTTTTQIGVDTHL